MATEEPASRRGDETSALSTKHPLQHSWCLWFYRSDRSKSWEDNLTEIAGFSTVEDFWALYNHIELPGRLPLGCDYAVFKEGVKPMWEDPVNRRGGKWALGLPKGTEVDTLWIETLMCLIGEAFDEFGEGICGAVIQLRPKADRLAVWTSDARDSDATARIGRVLKERLRLHSKMEMYYEAHTRNMV